MEPVTKVANLREDGWINGGVYIGRPGKGFDGYFGNPFPMGPDRDRQMSIVLYRNYFLRKMETDPIFASRVLALRGMVLLCFCKPLACHGDVIAEYLNEDLLDLRDSDTARRGE